MTYVGKGNYGDVLLAGRLGVLVYSQSPAIPVASLEDFPEPVAGVITLPAETSWQISGVVDVGPNRVELEPGASLLGAMPGQSTLLGNVATPLVTASSAVGSRTLAGLTISNAGGAGLQLGPSVSLAFLETLQFKNCSGHALRLVGSGVVAASFLLIDNCTDGILLSGALNATSFFTVFAYTNPAGFVAFDMVNGSTATALRIESCSISLGSASDTALRLNGSVLGRALVDSCQILGAGTKLTGSVNQSTVGWTFSGNQGLRDSTVLGDGRFVGTTPVAVAVPAANQWTPVNIATTALTLISSERFSIVGVDTLRYDGIDPANLEVTAQIALEHAGGAAPIRFEVTCQRNGTPAVGSTSNDIYRTSAEVAQSQVVQMQTEFLLLNVQQNDTFRVLYRNATSTTAGEILSVALSISEA